MYQIYVELLKVCLISFYIIADAFLNGLILWALATRGREQVYSIDMCFKIKYILYCKDGKHIPFICITLKKYISLHHESLSQNNKKDSIWNMLS